MRKLIITKLWLYGFPVIPTFFVFLYYFRKWFSGSDQYMIISEEDWHSRGNQFAPWHGELNLWIFLRFLSFVAGFGICVICSIKQKKISYGVFFVSFALWVSEIIFSLYLYGWWLG
ncbi:MAG: hypothetical protein QM627_05285 [Luteolibacter sp.]